MFFLPSRLVEQRDFTEIGFAHHALIYYGKTVCGSAGAVSGS